MTFYNIPMFHLLIKIYRTKPNCAVFSRLGDSKVWPVGPGWMSAFVFVKSYLWGGGEESGGWGG